MELKFIGKEIKKGYISSENDLSVMNKKNELLGRISWDKNWKCHVWEQEENIIMSADCLEQIVTKLKELDRDIEDLKAFM